MNSHLPERPWKKDTFKRRLKKKWRQIRGCDGNVFYGYGLYDRPLLVSYSRSGTNWIRYIIEYLSGRPTPGQQRLFKGKPKEFFIDRAHCGFEVMHQYKRVMLVIRDYRECLLRHNQALWARINNVNTFLEDMTVKHPPVWYIQNIRSFDAFTGDKLVLYYEDILSDPSSQIPELCEFLGFSRNSCNKFLEDLPAHAKKSVNAYTATTHTSETKQNPTNFNFHASKNLTPAQRIAFDEYYRKQYPDLFEKYLSRYADTVG
jgi:hypothetical protein